MRGDYPFLYDRGYSTYLSKRKYALEMTCGERLYDIARLSLALRFFEHPHLEVVAIFAEALDEILMCRF